MYAILMNSLSVPILFTFFLSLSKSAYHGREYITQNNVNDNYR